MYHFKHTVTLFTISISTTLIANAAYALTPVQYQEQRSEVLEQQQIPNPSVNIDTAPYKTQTQTIDNVTNQPNAEEPCFQINHIYLTGELAESFNFALYPYTNGAQTLLGSCMTVNDINQLVTNIQNHIIEKGYITTRVLVHNQNLKSGNLILTLIAGRIDRIIADDIQADRPIYTNSSGNPANIKPAMPMQSGDLLNVRDIEQALENLKRVPTAEADISIAPSSTTNEPGYSDILIKWQQDQLLRLSASVDDSGQKSTGVYQGTVTLSIDNPTWYNDLLYLSYNHSLDNLNDNKDNDSWGYNIGYTFPINNTQFIVTHSGYNYAQTVAGANQDYIYSGESYNTEANIRHLVNRNSFSKTFLLAGGFNKQQRNYIDDTEVEVQRRQTSGYKMGIGYETNIKQTQIIANLKYEKGTGAFSAMTPPEALFNEGSARAGIIKTNVVLNRPFQLFDKPLNYHLTFRGQYADQALVPSERFSIGGRYTVRGFDGNRSLSGDQGALIRQALNLYHSDNNAIYLGLDAGYVKMVNLRQNKLLLGNYLVGGVIGLEGNISPLNVNYDLFAGYPLEQPERFSDKQWVTGFSLGWQY